MSSLCLAAGADREGRAVVATMYGLLHNVVRAVQSLHAVVTRATARSHLSTVWSDLVNLAPVAVLQGLRRLKRNAPACRGMCGVALSA